MSDMPFDKEEKRGYYWSHEKTGRIYPKGTFVGNWHRRSWVYCGEDLALTTANCI